HGGRMLPRDREHRVRARDRLSGRSRRSDRDVGRDVYARLRRGPARRRCQAVKILAELREQGRAQDMQALVDHIPYARFLGIRVDRKGNEITTVLPFRDELVGNVMLRALHGGAIGAFLEITATIELLFVTACERLPKTVDISIDYLRSGRPVETYGRAVVTRH